MATQLFLLNTVSDTHLGTDNMSVYGIAWNGWSSRALGTARGSGVVASIDPGTVTGPTTGVEVALGVFTVFGEWISSPVAADVTISGTITANVWAEESNMSANVAINVVVDVIRANALATRNSNTIVEIGRSARVTEVAVGTRAVNNFTFTPTSTVVNRGDRLRIRVFGDDVGTMATGYAFTIGYNGTTASVDGDTYVTLTENLTFESAPAGTVVYLTDTASAVATASVDKEAWTSPGSGVVLLTNNSSAGWTAPIQVTDSAGGTAVDWFTKPLTAFTLTGMAVAKLWPSGSGAANATMRAEIARVAGDGTSPTVWASWCIAPTGTDNGEVASPAAERTANISGDDLAITNGQRLRLRLYFDDSSSAAMGAGASSVFFRYGTASAGSGFSYFTFPQTLTEYSSGPFTYTKSGYGREAA